MDYIWAFETSSSRTGLWTVSGVENGTIWGGGFGISISISNEEFLKNWGIIDDDVFATALLATMHSFVQQ